MTGTVQVRGARRRVRLTPLDASVTAAAQRMLRLRFPRPARALARHAGRRALVVRVTVTLADPGAELTTRRFRLVVRR